MSDINRVVIAHWKLKKWLESRNFNKIMVAESALNQIDVFLKKQQIEVIDLTGERFNIGLAVDILETDTDLSEQDNEEYFIEEMTKPIVMKGGIVTEYGEVKLSAKNPNILENRQNTHNSTNEKKLSNQLAETKSVTSKPLTKSTSQMNKYSFYIILALIILGLNAFTLISIINFNSEQSRIIESMKIQLDDLKNTSNLQIESIKDLLAKNESILIKLKQLEMNENKVLDQYGNQLLFIYHKVQFGENLIGICDKYSIDYQISKQLIQSLNGLSNNNLIRTGQIIILPKEKIND